MNLIEAFKKIISIQRSTNALTPAEFTTLMFVINEFNDQHWPPQINGNVNVVAKSAGLQRVAASSIDKFRRLNLISSDNDNKLLLMSGLTNDAVPAKEIINNDNDNVNSPTSAALSQNAPALTESELCKAYGAQAVNQAISIAKKRHKAPNPKYLQGILRKMKGAANNVLPQGQQGDDSPRRPSPPQQGDNCRQNQPQVLPEGHLRRDSEQRVQCLRQDDDLSDDLLPSPTEIARLINK